MFALSQPQAWRPLLKLGLAITFTGAMLVGGVWAKGPASETGSVAFSELPLEAQATEALIRAGGPFPYAKDGSVFGNRERMLPSASRGFYREYTVKTPRFRDRGVRRIICGGRSGAFPESCYYTSDHYASFRRIVP